MQQEEGHEVSLLWPGRIKVISSAISILESSSEYNIKSYEMVNPLPVPLLNGINDVNLYIKKGDLKFFEEWIKKERPDVIHIHTLMGLYQEFVEAAVKANIKIVYTSHDYFGLCPKVNLFDGQESCSGSDLRKCKSCCSTALSRWKVFFLQSRVYRHFKDTAVVQQIRKKEHQKKEHPSDEKQANKNLDEHLYDKLRKYYLNIFSMISLFHFNSRTAYGIYNHFFSIKQYKILPITHKEIRDNRVKKEFTGKLKIAYLGPCSRHKGFYELKNILDELFYSKKEFILNIYNEPHENAEYFKIHKSYSYSQLYEVFGESDVLIVPSKWYETFGFVVLEALSFGVPVILSDKVGAKDLICQEEEMGFVFKNKMELKEIISDLYSDRKILERWNKNIVCSPRLLFNMSDHERLIMDLYCHEGKSMDED